MPRAAASRLRALQLDCIHVSELGMAAASDEEILDWAAAHDTTVITLDADFHAILAVRRAEKPSVVRIRIQGLAGPAAVELIHKVLLRYLPELVAGAMIRLKERKITCHLLSPPE